MNVKLLLCHERIAETAADIAADADERSLSCHSRGDKAGADYWRSRSAEMSAKAAAHRERVDTMMADA